ncbi:MAG: sugar phosphate isomerase/epimerase [Bryobacteraceae bacterium]
MLGLPLSLHPCIVGWRVPWPGLATLAAAIGYEGAAIPRDQPLDDQTDRFAVRATAMSLPVEVRTDDAAFENTLPRLRDACIFASRAGCRVATLGIPPSSEQPRAAQANVYRHRLKQCCAVLDEYAIRLALECLTPLHMRRAQPYEFIWHNAEMLDFGLSVSPHAGLIVDAWHWHHGGADPQSIRSIPPDRILDVHMSDSPSAPPEDIRDQERLLPGEGVIDLRLFFQLLDEKAYSGAVTVEVFGRGLADMAPADAARLAFEVSRTMLAGSS